MDKELKTAMDQPLDGLLLMALLTMIWTTIGEFSLKGTDYYTTGIFFILICIYFVVVYLIFKKRKKSLPVIAIKEDAKKEKLYWIILAAEGVAILVVQTILVNMNKSELFIPCFASIVGLHFFPLAKIFDRKFDYYMGFWTTSFAALGIFWTLRHSMDQTLIHAIVCFAAATATTFYGLHMISDAKKIYGEQIKTKAGY